MPIGVLRKKYLRDENKRPIGVILDLETFRKIEELLEDHFLAKKMKEAMREKPLSLAEAKKYYAKLKKRR